MSVTEGNKAGRATHEAPVCQHISNNNMQMIPGLKIFLSIV
jgi:hypothetical protein